MAHYFVNLCSTNQFLERWCFVRARASAKKVCLIIMEASHAVLRQMMLSLELWLLSCWLYLITDESGRLESLDAAGSSAAERSNRATQQQPVLVGLMRAKNTIFHILRPFISSWTKQEHFIIVAWKMLKSFLKKRMLNLYLYIALRCIEKSYTTKLRYKYEERKLTSIMYLLPFKENRL